MHEKNNAKLGFSEKDKKKIWKNHMKIMDFNIALKNAVLAIRFS